MSEYIVRWDAIGAQLMDLHNSNVPPYLWPKRIREERRREEIVRCRDCKMFDEHYLKCFRPVLYFDDDFRPHWTDETTFTAVTDAEPDGFCWKGERKVEEWTSTD